MQELACRVLQHCSDVVHPHTHVRPVQVLCDPWEAGGALQRWSGAVRAALRAGHTVLPGGGPTRDNTAAPQSSPIANPC